MNMLTICLVTKGREKFLPAALKSYERFLDTGEVQVVLVDNGCDLMSRDILVEWRVRFTNKVHYFRTEINTPNPSFHWQILRKIDLDWVIFPGDDDVLVYEIFREWKDAVNFNPGLKAFGSSARMISSDGEFLGQTRKPSIIGASDQIARIAKSFNEPPFFWPGLFFKFNAIPHAILNSRYVFDWWIGLQLVLSSNIAVTESIGINYRVHQKQESYQTTNRRKFFEGLNMVVAFIQSNEFQNATSNMSDFDKINLISEVKLNKPVYDQDFYLLPILKELAKILIQSAQTESTKIIISEKYLRHIGVLTKKNDLANLFNGVYDELIESPGNISVISSPQTCKALQEATLKFGKQPKTELTISCKHSSQKNEAIFIDCSEIYDLNVDEIADKILIEIYNDYERSGLLNLTLTPVEKSFVKFARTLLACVPNFIKQFIKQFMPR